MTGCGISQDDIATVLDIDPQTLREEFRAELDSGAIKATAQVAQSLFRLATEGNVTAAIFWMKARAGWREKQDADLNVRHDASTLSDDALAAIAAGGSRRTAKATEDKA